MTRLNVAASSLRSLLTGRRCMVGQLAHKTTSTSSVSESELNLEAVPDGDASLAPVVLQDEDYEQREQALERSRNKSRLLPQHRNMLNDTKPYDVAQSWIHNTVKYQRKMFGRYGLASNVDPRCCFPTVEERATRAEYERVAHPMTVNEMISVSREQVANERRVKVEREEVIAKKLDKLEQWTNELNAKLAKKESDARAAKERKDRLVEEVRRQFGFKMDSRDERFKELLAQKEKEDKKKQKEAKRKQKDDRMIAKLQEIETDTKHEHNATS